MGIDRNEQKRKADKNKMSGPRIWIPLEVLQGRAWASVSYSAKSLLIDLAGQLRSKPYSGEIRNNGDLTTALTVLEPRGWTRRGTIQKAAKELEDANLICKTRQGRLPNLATLYAVTWLILNESDKVEISVHGFPFKAYLLKDKPPILKKSLEDENVLATQYKDGKRPSVTA